MAATDTIRKNKTAIQEELSAERVLILNKVHEKGLITKREYNNLNRITGENEERHVVELVDKIMNKGEDTCQKFLDLLLTDEEVKSTFPELKKKLRPNTCVSTPVQASSAEHSVTMPPHVMLSYQWDDQALVKKIYNRLKDHGLPVWMDIEGGVTGNINDSMAAGVEEAAVICPFMTQAYQDSHNCKKELNYADTRKVIMVPVMLANNWEASEWLGLITAGLLWVDFRNAEQDEEQFEMCLQSLEKEIMINAGHLLAVEEPQREAVDAPEPRLKKKPGRGFRHAVSKLYIYEPGEQLTPPIGSRNTVELSDTPGDHCYWEEIKGNGCKYYKNAVTNRYLGFDPRRNQVHSEASQSESAEWVLLVDQTDRSHQRAVIIKNKHSESFLAVQNGLLVGVTLYNEDCKWILE